MHSDNDSLDSYISEASVMLEKFHLNGMPIFPWLNKFESVADYVGIPDHRMGEFLYSMLESPEDLKITKNEASFNYSYEEIKTKFLSRYVCIKNKIPAREQFKVRVQYEHETIEKYAESLIKLFDECSYKGTYRCIITKKFVYGLYDDELRGSFKDIRHLRFNDAVKEAIEMRGVLRLLKLVPYKQQADTQKT